MIHFPVGTNTAFALLRGHVIEIAKNHVPGIAILCSNCREECEKQKGNCRYCKPLSPEEIDSKVEELVGEVAQENAIVSLGGGESNRVWFIWSQRPWDWPKRSSVPRAIMRLPMLFLTPRGPQLKPRPQRVSNLQKRCQTRCGRLI